MNGVQLRLIDATGKPVLDLGDGLKVTVVFGNQQTERGALTPAFGVTSGRPGEYRVTLIGLAGVLMGLRAGREHRR
jgi:hypothetical protein